jgi:hypothetical protein
MKKSFVSFTTAAVLISLLGSCVSMQDREMNANEQASEQIVGTVTVEFTSFQFLHIPNKKNIKVKAYTELKRAAQKEYGNNIDIKNIDITGDFSIWGLVMMFTPAIQFGNLQKITAIGKVISVSSNNSNRITSAMDAPLSKTANRLIEDLKEELPRRSTIAILSVYSNDPAASTYALEKIEQQFYDARHFSIIEKRFIDQVRREKRLQESDDIDPAKAAELAKEEGWNVVVIGEISGSGSSRRLTLRAIDAEKGTILSRAMENF